jgi:hypothetical protein
MISPFPGMDPYIESCGLFESFHGCLIQAIADVLVAAVPDRYLVRPGERSFMVLLQSDEEVKRSFLPDISVKAPRSRRSEKGGVALAEPPDGEPVVMRACIQEEQREQFVEIYEDTPEHRLVTSIEVLSASNKTPRTPGWELYQRKRQCILLGKVNLVEIDLLRAGRRMPMRDPWPASPYQLLVARAGMGERCQVWAGHFRRPLPEVPVPLAAPDADIPLRLQPLIESIYQRFRYDRSIDYTRPAGPRLAAKDTAWLRQQLRAHKAEGR